MRRIEEEISKDVLVQKEDNLEVYGARVHNLRDIDVIIPRNELVVITGLSGSGKSSLAFDTIYAEGQRRYLETFSAYARQFIGNLERPDVDKIVGLSPVISIEQKSSGSNPRSTVGTITEVYDFMRLLFARIGKAYSYMTGEPMVKHSESSLIEIIRKEFEGCKIDILAPLVRGRKGHYRELIDSLRRQGYSKIRVDGSIKSLSEIRQLDRYKTHDIELIVDRIQIGGSSEERLTSSVQMALKQGKGTLIVLDEANDSMRYLSRNLMCPTTGIAYEDPEPNTFSFNSVYGACPKCSGLGRISEIDLEKVFPDKEKSIRQGGIAPLAEYKDVWIFRKLEGIGQVYGFTLDTPLKEFSDEALNAILYGVDGGFKMRKEYESGVIQTFTLDFEGIVEFILRQYQQSDTAAIRKWVSAFINKVSCPVCQGTRLKREALWFRINEKNIAELALMDLKSLDEWFERLTEQLQGNDRIIGQEIIREIRSRLQFLLELGLGYLTCDRPAYSLSGGESQRIHLATQIGSQLTGVLYILDEPSIGLHQRDNRRLIDSLRDLRDIGNSVIVVEHDKEMIESADYVIDLGPGAGKKGGWVVASGTPQQLLHCNSLTCEYLSGKKKIEIPSTRRSGNGQFLTLRGAKGNNLKNIDLKIPLGKFICVTGVSGSGKSTLINETLYPVISQALYRSEQKPLPYDEIEGLKNIDKIIQIDQSPIGRTPRSNPATYTKVFDEIRQLYARLPESQIRGYKPGRFSFNVKGGRCEACGGAGVRVIEMNFLPDVTIPCEVCQGKRYNRETLEIRYKGKSINDVLNMTIDQAVEFFANIPSILHKIRTLQQVGLGYITLGQSSTTLSGGEAQRVKLSSELSRRDTGKTLYILDEPTTGLHFEDVRVLLDVLQKLTDKGNTIIVIEHNMEVIKVADHIIDLGPEGGEQGGYIIAEGTPEEVAQNPESYTAYYLKQILS
ncbi:MAG: excinuclease ABC subunit UvrA [Lentimicrobium sp.]